MLGFVIGSLSLILGWVRGMVYQPVYVSKINRSPQNAQKKILVLDNELHIREVVRASLELIKGWDVLLAGTGEEGLWLARKEHPHAIVLDVMLPRMDGFLFLRSLRADPAIQNIPAILLTAKIQLISPEQLSRLGLAAAISKPFNPLLLSEQIAIVLGWKAVQE